MKNVTAAILVHNSLILIAKRGPEDKHANRWEFPGGKIEKGETPEQCLQREIKEELGIEVKVGDFFEKSIYHYESGVINLLTYWTYWLNGEIQLFEHDEYRWVTVDELKNFDFLPADVPIIKKLKEIKIP